MGGEGVISAPAAIERAVLAALDTVRDPELDESLPELGFVAGIRIEGGAAEVRLRLPTYFCAPNFAFLMVADAHRAVCAVPGVREARVILEDHFASQEITAGVEAGASFSRVFAGEADGGLEDLRLLFRRKALLARQHAICLKLLARGHAAADLAALTLADVPPGPEAASYLHRRAELGIDTKPPAALVITGAGTPVPAEEMERHLRLARAIRVSVEANAGMCRGLLATRYGKPPREEAAA
jgi:metal-sulfur cluster biosynthetic enzyme